MEDESQDPAAPQVRTGMEAAEQRDAAVAAKRRGAEAAKQRGTVAAAKRRGAAAAAERKGAAMPVEQTDAVAPVDWMGLNSIAGLSPASPMPHPWMLPLSSDPAAWDNNPHPPGGFLSMFNKQPQVSHNFHFVGGTSVCAPFKVARSVDAADLSPPLVQTPTAHSNHDPIEVDSGDEGIRTEKRILWTQEEDVRLMSSWLENSLDSIDGADKRNEQYWDDVAEKYNMTTPTHRRRNLKQAKDRWHKVNKMTDLFHCAWLKARRIYTSGHLDQMWIDKAHKFYEDDNKQLKLGHFVLMDVWYLVRNEAKWITYNNMLKNARKRKSSDQKEEMQENSEPRDDVEKPRPMGQKAAKKAAYAARVNSKEISKDNGDEGKLKESAIDVDQLDRFSKIQSEANENRMKVLELQQKLSVEKLESARLAHLAAKENKEAKMHEKESKTMEAYNSLLSRDTRGMSDDEKAEYVAALKCFRKRLFPEND